MSSSFQFLIGDNMCKDKIFRLESDKIIGFFKLLGVLIQKKY